MIDDPIVDEVRRIREEYARRFNYDLRTQSAMIFNKNRCNPGESLFRFRQSGPKSAIGNYDEHE